MRTKAWIALTTLIALSIAMPGFAMGERKPRPDRVDITESMRICQSDSDCVQIERSCSGCCDYDAVAKDQQPLYDKMDKSVCADYKGGVCECHDPDRKQPACINQRCVMVKPKQPTQ